MLPNAPMELGYSRLGLGLFVSRTSIPVKLDRSTPSGAAVSRELGVLHGGSSGLDRTSLADQLASPLDFARLEALRRCNSLNLSF